MKNDIIISEGATVTVTKLDLSVVVTKALFGRATRQSNTMLSLETTKKAQFLPEFHISGGFLVYNTASQEHYIMVATMKEVIRGVVVSNVCQLYNCNAEVTAGGTVQTADENGNKSTTFSVKKTSKAHVEYLSTELRSLGMGISKDSEYRIFMPYYDADILDKLTVEVNSNTVKLKVVSIDFVTYDGVVIIEACTETRK